MNRYGLFGAIAAVAVMAPTSAYAQNGALCHIAVMAVSRLRPLSTWRSRYSPAAPAI